MIIGSRLKSSLLIIAISLFVFFTGCAPRQMQPGNWRDDSYSRFWPEAPEQKRIELLRAVGNVGDLKGESVNRSFFEWLVGKSPDERPLVSPYGIAADGDGRVWIADSGGGTVHFYDLATSSVQYLDGGEAVSFVSPVDVEYNLNLKQLYVSDSSLAKVFVFSFAGDYIGEISPPGGFRRPAGLSISDSGELFVVDVLKGAVEVFDRTGHYVKSVGSAAAEDGLFKNPSNVHVDSLGNVYIVDSLRFRIEVQDSGGNLLNVIGQVGNKPGNFARPRGVSVDSFGHIYVTDAAFDNVQIFDLAGNLLLYFGKPGNRPGDFCLPAGLHIDGNDRIYVSDTCNYRFQIFQYLDIEK